MAVSITIAGADRTSYVVWDTLRIENILTKQVDRCTFKIRNTAGYKPSVGREVVIDDSGTTVFGGVITRLTEMSPSVGTLDYLVECSDYTRILDQHLVAEVYENMTIDAIIADLITNWAPSGFTYTQVDEPTLIGYIQFNYEPVSSCLEQLANIVGDDWYVDYTKDVYFKPASANSAPFDITDSAGVFDNQSLIIRRDTSQLRNSIIVRGGEYLGTEFTASVRADGRQSSFNLPYRYQDFKATLTGHALDIGIDYIDEADNHDALYNFNEKILRFKEADKPSQNATLSFAGKPYLPVIVKLKDQGSINSIFSAEAQGDGKYEYLVTDKSINSKEGARARALAEIRAYGETLSEGEFITETGGLIAGQKILINSASRGINENFVINKVTSTMRGPSDMIYSISLITTKTMDFISVMKKLLLAENKKITINDNETLDLVEASNEVINVADSVVATSAYDESEEINVDDQITVQALDYGVQFVLGPYTPSGTKRLFILDGSRLG